MISTRAWISVDGPGLSEHQKYVAIVVALSILVAALELVRRRKLREEYSFLWIGTAVILMALALEPGLLTLFQQTIAAAEPTSALFFGALMFLMLVSILVSLRLSRLTFRSKALTRQAALANHEIEELQTKLTELRAEIAKLKGKDVAKGGAA